LRHTKSFCVHNSATGALILDLTLSGFLQPRDESCL